MSLVVACLGLVVGACESAHEPASSGRAAGPGGDGQDESALSLPEPMMPPGDKVDPGLASPAALEKWLPEEIHGYVAKGPAQPLTEGNPMGGRQVTSAARMYERDGTILRLRVMDVKYADSVRGTLAKSEGITRREKDVIVIGQPIQGHKASAQWMGGTARVGLLIHNRLAVTISVAPATSQMEAVEVAEKLDLTPLEAIIAELPKD